MRAIGHRVWLQLQPDLIGNLDPAVYSLCDPGQRLWGGGTYCTSRWPELLGECPQVTDSNRAGNAMGISKTACVFLTDNSPVLLCPLSRPLAPQPSYPVSRFPRGLITEISWAVEIGTRCLWPSVPRDGGPKFPDGQDPKSSGNSEASLPPPPTHTPGDTGPW